MELYLRDDFKAAWYQQDPFQLVSEMEGEVFRNLEARRTYRFEFQGKGFFAKAHHGVGWKDIVENLLRFRMPVLGARNEWQALNKLNKLGMDTMMPVAFGERGYNPAKQQSFLITEELDNMSSLEEICENWHKSPPSYRLKKGVVEKLASISRLLHDNGINHRDYYMCHFLVPNGNFEQYDRNPKNHSPLRFYLIDLHRAQIRNVLPDRWRLKDLSGLYFSVMDYGFTQRDIFRFIRHYSGLPLKQALKKHQVLLQKINKKSQKLYKRMERKAGHPNY